MHRVPCRYCSKKVHYKHRAEHERLHGAKPKMRGRPTKTKHIGNTTAVETSEFYHKALIVEDPEAAPPTASTVFDPRAVVEVCAPSSQACSIALNTTIANWFPKFHTLEDRNKSLCGRDWTNCRRVRAWTFLWEQSLKLLRNVLISMSTSRSIACEVVECE